MNRTEKKCFLGSLTAHGLLAAVFLFGSAFFTHKPKNESLPIINIVDATAVDRMIASGGNPNVPQNQMPPPPAARPRPEPAPPTPPQQPPKQVKQPDPPKVKEPVKDEPNEAPAVKPDFALSSKKKPDKAKPTNSTALAAADLLKPVKRPRVDPEVERAQREEEERVAAYNRAVSQRYQRLADASKQAGSTVGSLSGRIGGKSVTGTEAYGPGGAAFVNHGLLVRNIYASAWLVNNDIADEDSTVKARVTIARDGRVLSARIIGRSGNAALDRSVQRVLDDIRTVPPLPAGSTDLERPYVINFNLKAMRQNG